MANARADLDTTIAEIEHAIATLRAARAAKTPRDFSENVIDAADALMNIAAQLREVGSR